jgi:hypothetical protein
MLPIAVHLYCELVAFPESDLQAGLDRTTDSQIAGQRNDTRTAFDNPARMVGGTIIDHYQVTARARDA